MITVSDIATKSKKRPLNIAIIGTGFIAGVHSNAFHQVGHFFESPFVLHTKLACGRDQTKLEAFARQWDWEETGTQWEELVTRPDIDVVDIAAPNILHAPIAIAAANAGKVVFCEKPLALCPEEAEKMERALRGKPNLVWFNYRRMPAVAYAKQLVDQGVLGPVFHYRAHYWNQSGVDPSKGHTWRYRRADAGSGAMGDLLSHSLDTAMYLNGSISELSAFAHTFAPNREVDDAVMLMARFNNSSLGSFEASRFGVGHRNSNGFEIYGSRGSLAFDLGEMDQLQFFDATEPAPKQAWRKLLLPGTEHPYSGNFWKPGHAIGYEHTFIATLGDFLQSLARGEAFHPNFEDGLKVQLLLGMVEKSAASRQWVRG